MPGENEHGGQQDGTTPPPTWGPADAGDAGAPPPPPPPGYTPFAPGEAGAQPEWGTAPQPEWGMAEPQKKSRIPKVVISIVVAVAVFGGIGFISDYRRKNADPFTTPQTIGNATLLTDPEFAKIAKETRDQVENVHRAVSGVYAVNGVPTFLIVAGDADDKDADSIYKTFRDEAKDDGTQLGPPQKVGRVLCAKVTDPDAPGVACFWGSKKSDGVLMHFGTDDPAEAGRLAQLAWDGVES